VECEAVGELDTALITQRSQVQILPPLQCKSAGQRAVSGVIQRPPLGFTGNDVSTMSAPLPGLSA
jgi:hypothetical protein